MDQEYQDYLVMKEALRTGELEGKPVGPRDRKVIGSAITRYESVNPGVREGVIPHGADETPPDPMAFARSDQSDPAGLSAPLPQRHANVKAKDDRNAAFGGNQGVRADFRDPTREDFRAATGRYPSSPLELEKFQIQAWNDYAQNAENRGAEAVRVPDSFSDTNLPKGSSLGERLKEKALTAIDALTAGAHGALSGAIPGAGKLASYAVGGPDFVKETDELTRRHPEAAGVGALYGGAKGVLGPIAGTVSGGAARIAGRLPVKSELLNAAGRTIGAGLGGAAAGAAQAGGENLAANLTGSDQHIDVADSALLGGAVGAGANAIGEGFKAASGAIERGKFGPGLKAGEELGGRPTLAGYKIAPGSELEGLEKSRVEGRLGSTADVATERLAPKYASAGRNITERVNDQAANESAAMREVQVNPAPVPPTQDIPYSDLRNVLPKPTNPDPVPPTLSPEHAEAVRKFTNGYDSTIRRLQAGEHPDAIIADLKPREHEYPTTAAEHVAEAQGARQALEDALAQHGAKLPTVYRGIGLDTDKAKGIVGSHSFDFSNKATSTSFDPSVARSFAIRNSPGYSPEEPNQLVFKLKGAEGLPAGDYADPVMRAEREAIENGGKYKITNRYRVSDGPDNNFPREPLYVVEGERVGADYKDPTVPRTVSLKPVAEAAIDELKGPNVLPDGPLRNILRTVANHPEVTMEEWEKLTAQVDQLANLNKSKGIVDPRLARISAALRESAEGFPGLNEMRAGQAERFQKNELTMKHGGLPLRNKEVPEWQNMTADEQKQLYGTLRNQTGDIHGQTHEPAASVPMVRRAMDEIASDAGLKAELDRIPKLEAIDQVRKAARPHGLNVRLNPGGASASAFGKALEFAEIRGYPTIKALGSVPPDSDIIGILTKSPKTMELLRRMRSGQDLGQGKLANRLGLRGGAIAGRIVAAKNEVTQEDLDNLKKLQAAAGGQESAR